MIPAFTKHKGVLTYAQTVLQDSPAAYWRLNDASGTTAVDSSGHGHAATYAGTYTLANPSLLPNGQGASFNSAAAADIAIPTGWISTVKSPLTIEAWIKSASFSNSPNILATYNNGWSFGTTTGGNLEVSNPGVALIAQDAGVLSTGTVYHVAVTWDAAGDIVFYINGVASSSFTGKAAAGAGVDSAYIAAYNATNNRWNGSLQEVALYPTALSAARIAAHYAAA